MLRVTVPAVGWSTPAIIRIKVDLPAPLAPTMPMLSPRSIVKFKLLNTSFSNLRM